MTNKLIDDVATYYSSKLLEFGATAKGVDWNSEQSQQLRFSQLCKIIDPLLMNFSILDYGCGYGAMLSYLRTKLDPQIGMKYIGFDVSIEMIKQSTQIFGGDEKIVWASKEQELTACDYVVASGIFNVKMDYEHKIWLEYVLNTLAKLDSLGRKGFSFNVLTSYSDKELMKDNLYYADPGFLFAFCKSNFSRDVALLHDYGLYEFSILVRK
ncbi:putative methyltransferase [Cytophagales bacterium WSM2-2]|nr:putative methyltransferase [Cytophagales bacterium WSM2-2]